MCHRRHKLVTHQLNPIGRDQTGREHRSTGRAVSGLLVVCFAPERSVSPCFRLLSITFIVATVGLSSIYGVATVLVGGEKCAPDDSIDAST